MTSSGFRLAIFASGGGTTAEAVIKECRPEGRLSHIIPVCVIASKPNCGVIEKAKSRGVEVLIIEPNKFKNEEEFGIAILKELQARTVTLVGQFGWLAKTPKNVIDAYKGYIINQHPGPLDIGRPDFGGKGMYGRRVHSARIAFVRKTNHDFWTEATSQRVAEEFDTGKVLKRKKIDILPDDTVESLQARMLPVEHEIQIETLEDFMYDRVSELERETPLIKPDELQILEDVKRDAIKEYPYG